MFEHQKTVSAKRMTVRLWLLCLYVGLTIGCEAKQNFNPVLRGPSNAFFSVGLENVLELSFYDVDGDPLSISYALAQEGGALEMSSSPILTKITGGALFTWRLGAEDSALIGTSLVVTFTIVDGAGGSASLPVRIAIVDPLRYGNQAIRLNGHSPNGYMVAGSCVEPTTLGVSFGGDVAGLIEFDLSHAPFLCVGEAGCAPVLERMSDTEHRLSWCAQETAIERSADHELAVSVGIAQGAQGFSLPLTYRFITDRSDDCPAAEALEFEVVESHVESRFADIRLTIQSSDVHRPMVSPYITNEATSDDLHGLPLYALSWLGGDQWAARILWPFTVEEGDQVSLLVSAISTSEQCEVVRISEPRTLTVRTSGVPSADLSSLCTPCLSDMDCAEGRCLVLDGQGRCGRECRTQMECGSDAYCQRVETLSGARATQCVPLNSSCLLSCGGDDLDFEQTGVAKQMQTGESITANACAGQTAIYSLNVQKGEGVRVSAVSDSQSLAMGMSIWMNGVDFWSTWDSKPQTVFELPCAQADLRLTTKLWPWRGTGRYQLVTEKLTGGCRDECVADELEAVSSVELVMETVQYQSLSLCGLDTDGFEILVENESNWSVLFNELSDEKTIDVRVLRLPHFGNVRTATVRQGDALDLSDLASGTYRVLLSAAQSRSVARYSVEFLRRVEVE